MSRKTAAAIIGIAGVTAVAGLGWVGSDDWLPMIQMITPAPTVEQPKDTIHGLAYVVDGDTLKIDDQYIRLAGIDAPEMRQLCLPNVPAGVDPNYTRCGYWSREYLIQLTRDHIVVCHSKGDDRYGRIVATCATANTPDLGGDLVRSGMAFRYPQYDRDCHYCRDEDKAKQQKAGLWGWRDVQMPWEWRKEHKHDGPKN